MCEFCENGKPIISNTSQFSDRIEHVACVIKGNSLSSATMIHEADTIHAPAFADCKIKFCPMCGIELCHSDHAE